MIEVSARLLSLLSLLQEKRFWTGSELARALDTTPRNLRRDITRLRSLGYPVHATSGVGGGYGLGAGADLPPLPLTDEEAVGVAVGLQLVASSREPELQRASIRALAKLERVLPDRVRRRVRAIARVSIGLPGFAPPPSAALGQLAMACADHLRLRFTYHKPDEATSRRVEPYHLVHRGERWYLLAWDEDRRDWRTFRVDRVSDVEPCGTFRPRALPSDDLAAWLEQSLAPVGVAVHVTVEAPAERVRQALWGWPSTVEPVGHACCDLRTVATDLSWMAMGLVVLEAPFHIHEPAALRDHCRALGVRLLAATDGPGAPGSGAPPR